MLSKRARAALDILRSEAPGNKDVASALASIEASMGSPAAEQATPGSQSAKRAMAEKAASSEEKPSSEGADTKSSGDPVPPQFAKQAKKDTSTDGATAPNSFVEMMKRRRGSAQKRK